MKYFKNLMTISSVMNRISDTSIRVPVGSPSWNLFCIILRPCMIKMGEGGWLINSGVDDFDYDERFAIF